MPSNTKLTLTAGRTARIGNVGIATSFYSDRNDDIAEALVKLLVETKQDIPDFLERYVPEGTREGTAKLDFDDDSAGEEENKEEEAEGTAAGNKDGSESAEPATDAASESSSEKPKVAEFAEAAW